MRIVVTGGTGNVGRRVVRELSELGHTAVVVTRDPTGRPALPGSSEYAAGDLADRASLVAAMGGADAVYLLTPLHPDEASLGRNAVRAAAEAGVGRLVFQSVHRAKEAARIPHFGSKAEIVDALADSGVEWTVLEPNNFYQNDLGFRDAIVGGGIYPQPVGPIGVSHVDCEDIADAAVRCLMNDGHAGRIYPLVGPESHTGKEKAAVWADALGRDVAYIGDDLDAWANQMRPHLPEWLLDDLVVMYRYFIDHGLTARDDEVDTVRQLLGREPRDYTSWVGEVATGWRS